MLMILRIRIMELKTRFSSTKNRKLLSLMQVSILENGRQIVKRFKILLMINLRRTKLSESTHRKVLGIIWDIHADNLIFDFTDIIELCNALEPTKRNILRIQGMLKDPLGLISPITLPIKIILQKLFEIKFERDKYIDTNTSQLRKRYIKGLKHVSSVSVTRHMLCY